jgi:hypothetical protein
MMASWMGDTNEELEGVLSAQQTSNLAYDCDNCTRCRAWGVGIRITGGGQSGAGTER